MPITLELGPVELVVANLDAQIAFYESVIGLQTHKRADAIAELGIKNATAPLLILRQNPSARRYRRTSGLYHFAILVPTRAALAAVLAHFATNRIPLQGLSDHGVSEAIYLSDPEGNGIEIYCDRPRAQWPLHDGALGMVTEALDIYDLLAQAPASPWDGLPQGTVMGHIHLHVGDTLAAEDFYRRLLGFDLMQRYPGASFLSVDGYHHHIAVNSWAGVGAPPAPKDALGLARYTLYWHDLERLQAIIGRLRAENYPIEAADHSYTIADPSGNRIRLANVENRDKVTYSEADMLEQ